MCHCLWFAKSFFCIPSPIRLHELSIPTVDDFKLCKSLLNIAEVQERAHETFISNDFAIHVIILSRLKQSTNTLEANKVYVEACHFRSIVCEIFWVTTSGCQKVLIHSRVNYCSHARLNINCCVILRLSNRTASF